MRLIDADDFMKNVACDIDGNPFHGNRKTTYTNIRNFISVQPTVDAVPVIRCCQCKASEPTDTSNTVFCKAWGRIVFKNGFCSYADRKESENDG